MEGIGQVFCNGGISEVKGLTGHSQGLGNSLCTEAMFGAQFRVRCHRCPQNDI